MNGWFRAGFVFSFVPLAYSDIDKCQRSGGPNHFSTIITCVYRKWEPPQNENWIQCIGSWLVCLKRIFVALAVHQATILNESFDCLSTVFHFICQHQTGTIESNLGQWIIGEFASEKLFQYLQNLAKWNKWHLEREKEQWSMRCDMEKTTATSNEYIRNLYTPPCEAAPNRILKHNL